MADVTVTLDEKIRLRVQADTPDGYELFYTLIHNRQLPKHARRMVEHIYAARAAGEDAGLEAFRGSTKTTTVITFIAYQIGLHPELEWVLFQAGEESAAKNMAFVAD